MQRILLLLGLMVAVSPAAISQVAPSRPPSQPRPIQPNILPSAPSTSNPIAPTLMPLSAGQCRGVDLSMRHVSEDAAMGGEHLIVYAFRNNSSTSCTLKGYPRYELLDKTGRLRPRGRAINSQQLPGDEIKVLPRVVTVEPGKEAWFRVHYNSGGAGHVGKPCPVSPKVRVFAPGTARPFVMKEELTSCRSVEVSAVRGEPLP
jgi:hypothetical protein